MAIDASFKGQLRLMLAAADAPLAPETPPLELPSSFPEVESSATRVGTVIVAVVYEREDIVVDVLVAVQCPSAPHRSLEPQHPCSQQVSPLRHAPEEQHFSVEGL